MKDTFKQPEIAPGVARPKRNEWPIFISYRRSEATRKIAIWLKDQLERTTIKATTGQVFSLDVFVDAAESHQTDFQANLVPHLQHSRALIVLADEGAAAKKTQAAKDYLYEELEWWATERKKTPPIILQLDSKSALRIVEDSKYEGWRKVNFMDCFWDQWALEPDAGDAEKARLLKKILDSIRDYGQVIHLDEVRRLKRRALIALVFAAVALVAAASATWMGLLANKNAARARAQSDRSMALALSSQSREVIGKNDQRALLLAVESARRTSQEGYVTPAARSALQRALARVTGVGISGHRDFLILGEFSDDEKFLATGAFDKEVRVWNISNPLVPKCAHILQLPENAESVAFDNNANNIVTLSRTGSEKTRALVWHLRDGDRYPVSRPLTSGGTDDAIAVSRTGALLAIARSVGEIEIISFADASRTKVLRNLYAPTPGHIHAIAFSKDGQVLIAGTESSHVWIWDLTTDRQTPVADIDADHEARRPNMERVPIDLLGISEDHALLYTGSSDWFDNSSWADLDLKLWRLRELKPIDRPIILSHRGASNSGAIKFANFAADSSHLITISIDGWVRSWPLSQILSGKASAPDGNFQSKNFAESGDLSPDGTLLAFPAANEVHVLREEDLIASKQAPSPTSLPGFDGVVRFVRFSPSGRFLAAGGLGNTVRIWDMRRNDPTTPADFAQPSPYGPALDSYLNERGDFAVVLRSSQVEFWNLVDHLNPHLVRTERLDEIRSKRIAECLSCTVLISSNQKWAAIQGTNSNQADVIELTPKGRRFVVPTRVWSTNEIQFSMDGHWLFVNEKGNQETLYDLQTPEPAIPLRKVIELPIGSYSRTLLPNGRFVLYTRFVNLYQDPTGRQQIVGILAPVDSVNNLSLRVQIDGFATGIGSKAFSDNGNWMALAGEMNWPDRQGDDKVIRVFRLDDLRAPTLSLNQQEFVASPQISGNGRWLLSASDDVTLRDARMLARLYRIDTKIGEPKAQVLPGVTTYLHSARFSPDGRFLVTISGGGPTARLWRLSDSGATLATTLAVPKQELNWHWDIVFSRDGTKLVIANTADNPTPYVWNLTESQIPSEGTPISNGDRAIQSMTFDANGQQITIFNKGGTAGGVSGTPGSHVTIVDLNKFPSESSSYQIELGDSVHEVAVRQDCGLLLCAGGSLEGKWIQVEQMIRSAESAVGRNLTLDEWVKLDVPEVYRPTFPRLGVDGKTLTALPVVVERLRRERPREARQLASNLIAWTVEHNEADVCNLVAWSMALQFDGKSALNAVSGALAYFPNIANYRDTRGVALALLGRRKEAIADFEFFVKAEATNPLLKDDLERRRKWIQTLRDGKYPFTDGIE